MHTLSTRTIVVLATLVLIAASGSASADEFFTYKIGKFERATGFRDWPYVGTPLTPNTIAPVARRSRRSVGEKEYMTCVEHSAS